jgi:protein gp37
MSHSWYSGALKNAKHNFLGLKFLNWVVNTKTATKTHTHQTIILQPVKMKTIIKKIASIKEGF